MTGNKTVNDEKTTCLVCGMIVSRKTRFTLTFRKKKRYFCCNDCKAAFAQNPFRYTLA